VPDGAPPPDAPTPFVPAPHPPFPQLVKGSGSVLATPRVVGVFFSDYTFTDDVSAMIAGLPTVKMSNGETFWTSTVAEYGVGALTVLPPIKLAETAPTSLLTNPMSWLQGKLDANDPQFADVDENTIVEIYYPATTPLIGSCANGGNGYGGFHMSISAARGTIPIAVVADCGAYGPWTELDTITIAGSHEVIEACTDPQPTTLTPAYSTIDANGWAMHVALSGNEENGDMCTINNAYARPPAPYGYLLQRGWSNHAAAAGNLDPCTPDMKPEQPYVGAYPVMPDTVSVFANGSGPGVKIAVGSSHTIEVDCFSFEPTAPFTVVAREIDAPNPPNLAFAWDKTTCVNGDKLQLTITVNHGDISGTEKMIVRAKLANVTDPQSTSWAGIISQ
jgi:hypothetical protein